MPSTTFDRRELLKSSLGWAGAAVLVGRGERALGFAGANNRPRIGAVGTGSRWCIKATGINAGFGSAPSVRAYGDYVAVCDADQSRREHAGKIVKEWTGAAPDIVSDYRAIIDRHDIDIVHISTPEHWHAKVAIEAMRSGKDVYCEKPMTLTIAEGQQMCETVRNTGRIVQIGTQQRSDPLFIKAIASQYNTATEFLIKASFADGREIEIRHDGNNGILFEGTAGHLFVDRGRLTGKAVDELKSRPLPEGAMEAVYKNRPLVDHFRNFFESVVARREPISDVFSHHRALTTCHLAGIAARLGRKLRWDPKREAILDDGQAQGFIARERRKGFEIEV